MRSRWSYHAPFDKEMPHHYIMCTDMKWWLLNYENMSAWLDKTYDRDRASLNGIVISFALEEDANMFLLRWS